MRRWLCVPMAALLVSACSSQVAQPAPAAHSSPATVVRPAATAPALGPIATATRLTSPGPSPSAAHGAPALGVLVDLLSDPASYTVTLVDGSGKISQQVHAAQRAPIETGAGHAVTLPYVSTTLKTLYYLDGDSTLQALRLDGSTATPPAALPVRAGMEAAFSVNPSDTEIAVSVLDFNKSPVHVTLYTDTIPSGDRHVIYESDTNYVWPVAWLGGSIVLAHAYGPYDEDIAKTAPGRDNPYSAISYHVVNPLNADRVQLLGSCTVSGPLSPAGSGCIQGGSIDWHGNTAPWSTSDWGTVSAAAALSPDGQWIAAANPNQQTQMAIWRHSDGLIANYVDGPGALDWAGWLDDETLIVGSYTSPEWRPFVVNVIRGGIVHYIAAHGFVAAVLPTPIY